MSAAPMQFVHLLVGVGVVLVCAGFSALRRPLAAPLVVALPTLLVAAGAWAEAAALSTAKYHFLSAVDNPDAAVLAVEARALAAVPGAVSGLGGAFLFSILASGAAMGSLRGEDRRWLPLAGAFVPGAAALALLVVGALVYGEHVVFGLAALLGTWLWVWSCLAFCGPSGRLLGGLSAILGYLALDQGCHALFETGFSGAPLVDIRSQMAGRSDRLLVLHVALLFLSLSVPVSWVASGGRRGKRDFSKTWVPSAVLYRLAGLLVLVLLTSFQAVSSYRADRARQALSDAVGAWPGVVLALGAPDLPTREPLPTRLLLGREGRFWMQTPLGPRPDGASGLLWDAAVGRDDGLILPEATPLGDLYILLAGKDLPEVKFVGCGKVPWGLEEVLPSEKMGAVGLCGALPLKMRVTDDLQAPRVLIVLPEGQVDDGGDVVDIAGVTGTDGVAVVVRGQENATVGDLLALLRHLEKAGTLYLGWGVAMDGDSLGVGVNPGLRVRVPVASDGGIKAGSG